MSAQLRVIEDVKDNGDSDEKLGHSCKSGLPGCKIVEPEEQNEIHSLNKTKGTLVHERERLTLLVVCFDYRI